MNMGVRVAGAPPPAASHLPCRSGLDYPGPPWGYFCVFSGSQLSSLFLQEAFWNSPVGYSPISPLVGPHCPSHLGPLAITVPLPHHNLFCPSSPTLRSLPEGLECLLDRLFHLLLLSLGAKEATSWILPPSLARDHSWGQRVTGDGEEEDPSSATP